MRLSDFDHWAQDHHGLITLHASGLDGESWRRALRSGSLIEVHRHVARVPGTPTTPIQQIHAGVLAGGDGAAASHRSAAMLLGLLPFDNGGGVHITMASRSRNPRLIDVYVHRPTDCRRLTALQVRGIACTNPLRTLCDLGADDPALIRPALDSALAARLITLDALSAAAGEHARRGRGGIPALRTTISEIRADLLDADRCRQAQHPVDAPGQGLDPGQRQRQTLKRKSITSPSWAT